MAPGMYAVSKMHGETCPATRIYGGPTRCGIDPESVYDSAIFHESSATSCLVASVTFDRVERARKSGDGSMGFYAIYRTHEKFRNERDPTIATQDVQVQSVVPPGGFNVPTAAIARDSETE